MCIHEHKASRNTKKQGNIALMNEKKKKTFSVTNRKEIEIYEVHAENSK